MEPKIAWIANGPMKEDLITEAEEKDHEGLLQMDKPFALAFRQFLSEVSVVGARYISNQNIGSIRRFFWCVLVSFGIGFAIYQISEQARIYLSYPVTVKMNITDMPSLKFPTITVCNENIMNRSKTLELDPTGNLSFAFSEAFAPLQLPGAVLDNARVIKVFSEWNSENWRDIYSAAFLDYKELLIECSFDGTTCNPTDFATIDTNIGHCLQFNPYGNLTSEVVGSANGLQLILTADVDQYNNPTSASAGYKVVIHHQSEIMNNDVSISTIKVDVNHHTQIKIQSEEIQRMPDPYGSCNGDKNYVYSRCSVLCFEKYMIDKCGCGFTGFLTEHEITCSPLVGATCASPLLLKYTTDRIESTQCDCPPQCTKYEYPFQVSTGAFSDFFIKWMQRVYKKKIYTREYMEKNFVILDIYYNSLQKTEMITQPAYTLLSLLCDIGGALGLILGSTVLTFFEIFDFCVVSSSSAFKVSPSHSKENDEIKPQ